MTLEAIKVFVETAEQSELTQRALFALGYKWTPPSPCVPRYLNEKALYGHSDGSLSWGYEDFYLGHLGTPILADDLIADYLGPSEQEVVQSPQAIWPFPPSQLTNFLQQMEGTLEPLPDIEPAPSSTPEGINPKQGAGSVQLPMTLCSPLLAAHISLAGLNGKGKYGGSNYIGTHVTMSTYLDAMQRHLDKIRMGEEFDEVDDVSHWGAIGKGMDIILCARAAGTLVDDRLRSDGQLEAYKALTPMVKRLTDLHKDRNPYHYLAVNKELDNPTREVLVESSE